MKNNFDNIKQMTPNQFVNFLMEHTTPDVCTFCTEDVCDAEKCLKSDAAYGRACKKIIVKWLKSDVNNKKS